MTVITAEECTEILKHNTTRRKSVRRGLDGALPSGITTGMLCCQGQGFQNEHEVEFSGPCAGDIGGPLKIKNRHGYGRETLIGIIAGGVGCGLGIPNWFTRVSFYRDWIK